MNRRSAFLVLGFVVAAGGVGFFAMTSYRSFTPPANPTPDGALINVEGAAALEATRQFLTPQTEEDRAQVPDRIAEAMRSVSPDPRDAALMGIMRERLAIAVNPDYERYVAHVAAVTGQSAGAVRSQLGDVFRERWEISSQGLRNASFGLDGCEIQPGDRILNRAGGGVAMRNDPGIYGSARLLADERAELRQVSIPVILYLSLGGQPQTLLVNFVTGFVWDASRSRWIPFIAGFYDPSGQEERLPAPWI